MSEPFNQLTPAQAERLALLAEECAEVIQVVGKILRHGYESTNPASTLLSTNRELLEIELGHVSFARSLLILADELDTDNITKSMNRKAEKAESVRLSSLV